MNKTPIAQMKSLEQQSLIVILGLPGVGKTAVCEELLRLLELSYIATDQCWIELFPTPEYTAWESQKTYEFLCEKVRIALSQGTSVLVEGVFASPERLSILRQIAFSTGTVFRALGLRCEPALAFERMDRREREGGQSAVPRELWRELELKLRMWPHETMIAWFGTTVLSPRELAMLLVRELSQ